jgi:hypothetical protein
VRGWPGEEIVNQAINIIFDGPPGPDRAGFVEVETDDGKSINAGKWIPDGNFWKLRITELPGSPSRKPPLVERILVAVYGFVVGIIIGWLI